MFCNFFLGRGLFEEWCAGQCWRVGLPSLAIPAISSEREQQIIRLSLQELGNVVFEDAQQDADFFQVAVVCHFSLWFENFFANLPRGQGGIAQTLSQMLHLLNQFRR